MITEIMFKICENVSMPPVTS